MAGDYDELKAVLTELILNTFAPKPEFTRGLLGDGLGNVTVPGRPDKNYVRFNRGSTEFFEVFNVTVNPVNDWPVLIGELPWLPGLTQVVGTDWAAYEQSGWDDNVGATSPHAPTHEWPDGSPGSDAVNVYTRSIVPLRAYTLGTGSTTIYVNSYEYQNPNGSGTVWGGLPGIDLAPVMSSMTTGTARLMGVYLDPSTNALGIVTGASDIFTDASDPPLAQFPGGVISVARIRVYGGQINIGEADIRDARRPFDYLATGTISAGGYPFNIITVDPTDTDADYSDLASAISAASAGDMIKANGTYTITSSSLILNKAVTLQGTSPEAFVITSALANDETLDITAAATLRNCTVNNTSTGGTTAYCIKTSASGVVLDNVETNNTSDASSFSIGTYCAGGSDVRLTGCRSIATDGAVLNFGLYVEGTVSSSVALVEQGYYQGADATDIVSTGSQADITLVDPQCASGGVSVSSSGVIRGSIRDYKGKDGGSVVVNSSGASIAFGDVGYLDEAGEFQTTTTASDVVKWAVSVSTAGSGDLMFAKTRGEATVNYTGSAPAQDDYLVTSTTAGDAQAQSTMSPAIFAVCQAAGSGGQVDVLLLTGSPVIPYSSSNPLQQSPTLVSDSIWTGTINGAPSGATLVYTTSTGDENWLDATSTSALAKLRLYNSTRSEYALISDTNVGTNTITLTDNVPGTWADTDSLTIASQTNTSTSGGASFLEYEITDEIPVLARAMIVDFHWTDTGAAGQRGEMHPYESFAQAKSVFLNADALAIKARTIIMPLIQRRYTVRGNASGSGTSLMNVYIMGYVLASP